MTIEIPMRVSMPNTPHRFKPRRAFRAAAGENAGFIHFLAAARRLPVMMKR
jgi:hypothetical protein